MCRTRPSCPALAGSSGETRARPSYLAGQHRRELHAVQRVDASRTPAARRRRARDYNAVTAPPATISLTSMHHLHRRRSAQCRGDTTTPLSGCGGDALPASRSHVRQTRVA